MTIGSRKRQKLIGEILTQKYLASQAFEQYQSTSREYGRDRLYMREAHFITAVGPGEGKTISEVAESLAVTHGAASRPPRGWRKRATSCAKSRVPTAA